MNLKETVQMLRDTADCLQENLSSQFLPVEEATLQSAATRLRTILGDETYFSIQFILNFHTHRNGKPDVEWRIYDGEQSYKGTTLTAALNSCLIALAPVNVEQIEVAQELLLGATVNPF